MSSLHGLGFVVVLVLLFGIMGGAFAAHLFVRPRRQRAPQVSNALMSFEPKGGRLRFHVRLFEAVLLCSVWVSASALLALFAPLVAPSKTAQGFALGFLVTILFGTWWCWRRGVLRGLLRETDLERHS
jgi:hypothetical protein